MELEEFKREFANGNVFSFSSEMLVFNECKRKAHPNANNGKGFKLVLWLDKYGDKEMEFYSYESFFDYEYEPGKKIRDLILNTKEEYHFILDGLYEKKIMR